MFEKKMKKKFNGFDAFVEWLNIYVFLLVNT